MMIGMGVADGTLVLVEKTAVFPTSSISTIATCVETAVGVAVVQAANQIKIKSKRGELFLFMLEL